MFICHGGFVFLVPLQLLEDSFDLLEQRHQDNEGRCSEGPASADDCPGVELIVVKNVNGEHGSWPDDNKEDCEADSSNVGGDLGCSELSDDNL